MKLAVVLFVMVSGWSACSAQEPGSLRFATLHELHQWATTMTMGGGFLKILTHEGRTIGIVDHMYTSGVKSSGITIFVKRDTEWTEALRLGPYWNHFVEFKQDGDSVVLQVDKDGPEILHFSIRALHLQFEHLKAKP